MASAAVAAALLSTTFAAADDRTPKLLVLLMVDQFRGDYVERFQQQWTEGLHRLIAQGAWFRQVEYSYFDTVTCAGHASVSTGTVPSTHGLILNGWWERETKTQVTCTDDKSVSLISYGKPVVSGGESAVRLRVPTLADELRAQLSPAGRTISFSLKARSSVMLGGRRPAAVVWFDDSGAWVTSTAFSATPVREVADFVSRHPIDADFGKVWDRALPRSAYQYEDPAIGVVATKGMTTTFPHVVAGAGSTPDAAFYDRWQSSPYADQYLARMALDTAERMHLGQSARTDMIAISFSTLDKVGHDFGPNSHEIQDVLVRLDRTLGELFAGLDRLAGAGRYTVALTADHGVAPLPERSRGEGLDAGRVASDRVVQAVEQSLTKAIGPGRYLTSLLHNSLYLEPGVFETLRERPAALQSLRDAIEAVPGMLRVYTRDELRANRFDQDPIGRQLANSYYEGRSGDLSFVLRPYWTLQTKGAEHGTGYRYDTHVPALLMGAGIVPGEYLQPASPTDVAPTLAFLAGVTLPRTDGRVLIEALKTTAGGTRTGSAAHAMAPGPKQ